jgi:hypothetical protein
MQGRIVQFVLSGALIIAGSAGVGTALRVGLVLAGIWRCSCCCRRS